MGENTFKKDAGKLRIDLIDATATADLATILTAGSIKYAVNGWRKGIDLPDGQDKIVAALERHLNAFKRGEVFDRELGVLHVAQIMCNAMFLTWYARERQRLVNADHPVEPWGLPVGSFRHPFTREVVDVFALPADLEKVIEGEK